MSLFAAKPFLKWVGGKRQLLDDLLPHCRRLKGRYFEPFLGGGALFFALRPPHALLGDANAELVACYEVVRDQPDGLLEHLREHQAQHSKEHYYRVRALTLEGLSKVERAARFVYLNRTCFNGLYRVNAKNGFNVPMGRYVNPGIANEALLQACSAALQGVQLRAGDFEALVADAAKGELVYFDPPYVPLSASSSFTAYAQNGFGDAEQERLRDTALRLKRRGVRVLLSNSWSPRVLALYGGGDFELRQVQARRLVNSKAEKRGPIPEALIY